MMPSLHRTTSLASLLSSRWIVVVAVVITVVAGADNPVVNDLDRARHLAKPWYTESLVVFGVNLLITPMTLLILVFSLFYLYYAIALKLPAPSYAIASHILLSDHSDATKAKLVDAKAKIGTDFDKFSKMAAQLSECPSKNNGGTLGKFRPGNMVPPFDKIVFDPASPVRTALGPVETQFGWHLIYIQDRFLNEDDK
jgi:peptidyl-prolyl cis-trans isomerase C